MTQGRFTARIDDLRGSEVQQLIHEHLSGMHTNSPPGHVNAFTLDALHQQNVTFWSIWNGATLCGCAALKELEPDTGEVKSMRTRVSFLRQGVAQFALDTLTQVAERRGYTRLLLETGTGVAFEPAHRLYLKNGFTWCSAFGEYEATHFNVFMSKSLNGGRRVA